MRLQENLARAYSAVVVLTVCFAASALAAGTHIENFGQVNDTYFRGGQPKDADYPALAALGIKTVINLTSDDAAPGEEALVGRNGMMYLQIPMTTRVAPTREQIATFLRVVNDPARQPIYVHCVGGRHRTGVMTAVYRMAHDGWTAQRAFGEMKQYRFGADFLHPEFKRFVFAYESERAPLIATVVAPAP